ncbi:unnamed protein product [Parajaminaea phylloscopi]
MVLVHLPGDAGPSSLKPSNAKDYSHAYYHILKQARRHSAVSSAAAGAVLILAATDVDATCAARALSRLLIDDEIMYRIAPVDGFRTLQRILQEDVVGNEDLRSLVFLNLGSLLSLPTYFGADALPLPHNTCIHLIDSHRPWNLDNLFATNEIMDRIWVWDDGSIASRMQREKTAYEALEFEIDSDSEDDESESDSEVTSESETDEDEGDDAISRRHKRRRNRTTSGRGGDLDGDAGSGRGTPASDIDEQGSQASPSRLPRRRRRKRVSKSPKRRITREEKNIYRAVLSRYYNRGTGFGMSVAGMMFVLAEALGRAENEGLWLAILGLTSQYIANAIPSDLYEQSATSIASDVIALNVPVAATGKGQSQANSSIVKPTSADDGRIRVVDDELRFTLYRHWSLESAMYHTPYVAGKLGIWREKGLTKIRGLLAKMGFSLVHSRQHYNNMPLDLRDSLTRRLDAIAPEYGLTELVFKSFIRSFGFRSNPLSAADAVEGLNALLVAATGQRIEVQDEALTFSGAASTGLDRGSYGDNVAPVSSELFGAKRMWSLGGTTVASSRGGEEKAGQGQDVGNDSGIVNEEAEGTSRQSEAWVRNFFIAYEALDSRRLGSLSLLNSSLSLARSLHAAILGVGTSLIEKQSIRTLKSFRLAILRDGPHLDLFSSQPAMLSRLGLWLTDALRDIVNEQDRKKLELKKQRKAASKSKRGGGRGGGGDKSASTDDDQLALSTLPFVLCALDASRDIYLVVGLIGSADFGQVERNRFGLAFQDAIQKSGARSRSEGWFDTTAVEIRREDLSAFVEQLHLKA